MSFHLRPYQHETLNNVQDGVLNGQLNQLIVLATGTGKTVCFVHIPKFCKISGTTLILAHRDSLLYQAKKKWLSVHPHDRVGVEMSNERLDDNPYDAIVASVATLKGKRLEKFLRVHGKQITVVITDEAHHSTEESYLAIFRGLKCLPVDQETGLRPPGSPKTLLVGVTATENRMDKKSLKTIYPYKAMEYPILLAMQEKYLCRARAYRVETGLNLQGLNTSHGDFVQSQVEDLIDNEKRNTLMVTKWKDPLVSGLKRRSIIFCAGKDHAEHTAEAFRKVVPNVWVITEAVQGAERQAILDKFAWLPAPTVLVNINVATEGLDIPQTDLIIPPLTKSEIRFKQAVGRGLRPFDGTDINPLTGIADLPPKKDLVILDMVDVLKSQSDIQTAARLLDLPANFDLQGEDLLDAREMVDQIVDHNPALLAGIERMIDAGEQLPTTFEDLKGSLQRILLFAPSDTRGRAKEFSRLAWHVTDADALMLDDANNATKYSLQIPPPLRPNPGDTLDTVVFRLEKHTQRNEWLLSVLMFPPEHTALVQEARRCADAGRDEMLSEMLRRQHHQKARILREESRRCEPVLVQTYRGGTDLAAIFAKMDAHVQTRHSGSLALIDMTMPWRRQPATPGQISACRRAGIPLKPNATKGEAADWLTNYYALGERTDATP